MFDSIHVGRWLSQFTDQDVEFVLFPSRKFKKIHPRLRHLTKTHSLASFKVAHPIKHLGILGYIDFAIFEQISRLFQGSLRVRYLRNILRKNKFDYVHALEIQGAGYLCDEAITEKNFKLILTNWGSDIFYFQHLPEHLPRIKSALMKADLYSAECRRDYQLALDLGFEGIQLPCIPNSGGIEPSTNLESIIPTSKRKNIVVKTYGGVFGRGELAINAISKVLKQNEEITVYFYSVTEDLIDNVMVLVAEFENRISFSTIKNPVSHQDLSKIFERSRIYIGCSISDGISTSFLEALARGVYPIQTNTSCANEWIEKGAIGSIISLNEIELENALKAAIEDDDLVSKAAIANLSIIESHAKVSHIQKASLNFYGIRS
jgi:hypothetical protein